jgi:hypothetical protein
MLLMSSDFVGVKSGTACYIVPALRKVREGRGTHFCGCAGEVKSLGHPRRLLQLDRKHIATLSLWA